MKRILQVFGKLDRGGAETMVMNYYRHIDRSQYQFDFIVNFTETGAYEEEILSMGGQIFRLPRFKAYNYFSFAQAWDRFFKEHPNYNAIHVHNFKIAGIILPIAKKHGITMRIVHMHIANAYYSALRKLGYYLTKFLANKFATHRLACSQEAGKCYFGNRDFTVMHNAIDAQKFTFNPTIRKNKRQELACLDNFLIGHIGRFNEQKNHHFIIEIFEQILKKQPNALLLLLGIGELQDTIKAQVKHLNLEHSVLFLNSRSDVHELMMAMDVFLFPSLYEGLGIVAIEAQTASLPTLISNTVPDEAIITNLAKKISLDCSAEFWATEILKYNDNTDRQDMFEQIRKAGYHVNENIQWLEEFYANEK